MFFVKSITFEYHDTEKRGEVLFSMTEDKEKYLACVINANNEADAEFLKNKIQKMFETENLESKLDVIFESCERL